MPASLLQHDEAQRIEVQYRAPVSGRSVSHLPFPFSSPCRAHSRRATRGPAIELPCRWWVLFKVKSQELLSGIDRASAKQGP